MSTTQQRDTIPLDFRCPDWCEGGREGHQQALDEDCSWEWARVHVSHDYAGQPLLSPGLTGWTVRVTAPHRADVNHWERPTVEMEVYAFGPDARHRLLLPLTSGEARTMAAQLLRLADQVDLA